MVDANLRGSGLNTGLDVVKHINIRGGKYKLQINKIFTYHGARKWFFGSRTTCKELKGMCTWCLFGRVFRGEIVSNYTPITLHKTPA